LRQFGQVFVHGCGEIVPIEEYLPWMRTDENGVFQSSKLPLRCQNCGENAIPEILAASERARDMKVTCRVCKGEIQARLVARCPECTKVYIGQKSGDLDEPEPSSGTAGTAVARVVMRLVNSRANDAYYPCTLSLLRLDKIPVITDEDEEIRSLNNLLVADGRVEVAPLQGVNRLEELTRQLRDAIAQNNSGEASRLQKAIVQVATMQIGPPVPKPNAT
jgi:hypothetical protein